MTTGRILNGTAPYYHAMSSSEVIDMLNPSKKCNASSLPSARFWAKGKVFIDCPAVRCLKWSNPIENVS